MALTLDNTAFDPDDWALGDGEDLIRAGSLIIREINERHLKHPNRYQIGQETMSLFHEAVESCCPCAQKPT